MNRVYTLYKIGQKAVFFNASLRQSMPELVEAIQSGEAMEDVYGKPYTDKDRATTYNKWRPRRGECIRENCYGRVAVDESRS